MPPLSGYTLISILESTQSIPSKTLQKIKIEIEKNYGKNILPLLIAKKLLTPEIAESVEYLILSLGKFFPTHKNNQTQRHVNPCILPMQTKRDILFARTIFTHGLGSLESINECFSTQHHNKRTCQKLGQLMISNRIISGNTFIKIQKEIEEKVKKKDINSIILEDKMTQVVSVDGQLAIIETSIPKIFGPYRILKEIARGGMGVVYKAWDENLKRVVALKVLKQWEYPSIEETQRFQREARLAASLKHPNIVKIHDADTINGVQYFTMDYVQGETLSQLLEEKSLPHNEALNIIKDIALALNYAHSKKVIHRDVKPGNIILDTNGNPQLTDFGLAKALNTDNSFVTQTGKTLGTPAYMSPEQACGKKNIDARSDIYSLGAILYEIITGQPPFSGESFGVVISNVISKEAKKPSRLNSNIAPDLEIICLKAMSKELSNRYASAKEMAEDIKRHLFGENIKAKLHFNALKMWNKNRAAFIPAFLLMLVAFGIFVWNLNNAFQHYKQDLLLFKKAKKLLSEQKVTLAKRIFNQVNDVKLEEKKQKILQDKANFFIKKSNQFLYNYEKKLKICAKKLQLLKKTDNSNNKQLKIILLKIKKNYQNVIYAFENIHNAHILKPQSKDVVAVLKNIHKINVKIAKKNNNSEHVNWFSARMEKMSKK